MSVSKRECLERIRDLDTIRRKQGAEIDRLQAELDECRRLLREVVLRDGLCDERWFEEAKKAGGDDVEV